MNDGLFAISEVTVTADLFEFQDRVVREDLYPIIDCSGAVVTEGLAELDW